MLSMCIYNGYVYMHILIFLFLSLSKQMKNLSAPNPIWILEKDILYQAPYAGTDMPSE